MMPSSKSRRHAPVASDSNANGVQKRRKNVGTACSSCKSRKLKCTGAPPCANCIKSGHECTLDRTTDRRRRGVLSRDIDLLEDREGLLNSFRGFVQERSNPCVARLLYLMRNKASNPEIRFYLEHRPPRPDPTQTPELLDLSRALERPEGPHIHHLNSGLYSAAPRFSVPGQPWTSIVHDDGLVSRLISLWFTWVHPTCNFIDRDLFIRDMRTGSLSASYCSPFLVNVMLADACSYSAYAAYDLPDNLPLIQTNLYEEAKRLLDKEEGRTSLQTTQGLGVLWMCSLLTGRKRQGWISRGQLSYNLQEISLNSPHLSENDPDSACMARVVNHTYWGIFNLAMIFALSVREKPIIEPPRHPSCLPVDMCCFQLNQNTYPKETYDADAHIACSFNAVNTLNRITYNLGPLLFSQEVHPLSRLELQSDQVEALQELNGWPGHLPQCLRENVDLPHVLSLHMYHHAILAAVYGFLKTQLFYIPNTIALHRVIPQALVSQVHVSEACFASARKVAQLTLVHRSSWGSYMPAANVHYIIVALYALLDGLDDPVNCDAFVSLTSAAGAFAQRWGCAKELLKGLMETARRREVQLPREASMFSSDGDPPSDGSPPVKSETPETAVVQ
ncbi:hypothetical protein BJY04DRAFT_117494 [Aspergillus karnatakaensis]|uniref:putative C6 transcription factor n=1 Tax=Aspergillus karnatakaensis TaxID=1810916 RepID=UPI003CCD357C